MTFIKMRTLNSNRTRSIYHIMVSDEKAETCIKYLNNICLKNASVIDYDIQSRNTPFELTADDYFDSLKGYYNDN